MSRVAIADTTVCDVLSRISRSEVQTRIGQLSPGSRRAQAERIRRKPDGFAKCRSSNPRALCADSRRRVIVALIVTVGFGAVFLVLLDDRNRNPSRYAVVLVSEAATVATQHELRERRDRCVRPSQAGRDGRQIAAALKEYSPKYNNGRRIDVVNQRLGYLVRSGDPDALDSIVPMAFGNLAPDLILKQQYGRLESTKASTTACRLRT